MSSKLGGENKLLILLFILKSGYSLIGNSQIAGAGTTWESYFKGFILGPIGAGTLLASSLIETWL